jgi:hypothetical protein
MSRPMRDKARVVVIAVLLAGGAALVDARGGGRGGGGHASRGGARTSVSHVGSGSFNRNVGANVNRNVSGNVNRNVGGTVNRNVNRDVNFDRDINVDRNYGWGDGCCYHPVARATAAAATTAAVVGSEVNSIPPSCNAVSVNGLTYEQCGSTWYQPEFSGSTVTNVVVNPPK